MSVSFMLCLRHYSGTAVLSNGLAMFVPQFTRTDARYEIFAGQRWLAVLPSRACVRVRVRAWLECQRVGRTSSVPVAAC